MSLKTERAAATSGGVRALLSRPAYACYWLTRVLTQMASQMMMVALGWQMYDLTGSAWDLGLVGLVQFLPALLLTLPALYGSYRVNDQLNLRVAMENVTDRAYLVPLGDVLAFTLGRGRTLQGSVEYQF